MGLLFPYSYLRSSYDSTYFKSSNYLQGNYIVNAARV